MLLREGTSDDSSAVAELENETHNGDLTTDVANDMVAENGDVEMADQCDVVADEDMSNEKQVCSAALATRVHRVIEMNILPQLHKCLTKEVCDGHFDQVCESLLYS
jgi:hypothetical protein